MSPMSDDRVIRHRGPDRLFHCITAASVIVLLATGLLPQLGVHFGQGYYLARPASVDTLTPPQR